MKPKRIKCHVCGRTRLAKFIEWHPGICEWQCKDINGCDRILTNNIAKNEGITLDLTGTFDPTIVYLNKLEEYNLTAHQRQFATVLGAAFIFFKNSKIKNIEDIPRAIKKIPI